jgi:hypothetical protein
MGTRSLTYVYDGHSRVLCLYRQYDGYVAGHGAELAEFLKPFRLVNGLGLEREEKLANGMGCLAGQLVTHFKGNKAGDFYLMPTSRKLDTWQEYEYHIRKSSVTVFDMYGESDNPRRQIFKGSWEEFYQYTLNEIERELKNAA